MKKLLLLTPLFLLIAPEFLQAQTPDKPAGHGYVFFAPGGASNSGFTNSTMHAGGGGDIFVWKGLGAGAELGAIWPTENIAGIIGVLSVNGSYHFYGSTPRKVVPFVTSGYTLLFREGTANATNVGGGVTWWFREKTGLRLEFRDHIWSPDRSTVHLWQVRIGLSFR